MIVKLTTTTPKSKGMAIPSPRDPVFDQPDKGGQCEWSKNLEGMERQRCEMAAGSASERLEELKFLFEKSRAMKGEQIGEGVAACVEISVHESSIGGNTFLRMISRRTTGK